MKELRFFLWTAYVMLVCGAASAQVYTYTIIAGSGGVAGTNDGAALAALFDSPVGIALDSEKNVIVADQNNHAIRKISAAGVVTTLAGQPGVTGTNDGPAASALFYYPAGVAMDSHDNVYVSDQFNFTIRKISTGGDVTTIAGLAGISGSSDGTNSDARFNFPAGMAVDASDNVYVADLQNSTIRKVTPEGVVTTLAGFAKAFGTNDGFGSDARFFLPAGVAVDRSNNIFVADTDNNTIRKITAAGEVTTIAGVADFYHPGSSDGVGSEAQFYFPAALALDAANNIYVADTFNHTVRKINSDYEVTTIGGLAGSSGSAEGTNSDARFHIPSGIAADSAGNLYIANTEEHTIVTGLLPVSEQPTLQIEMTVTNTVVLSWPTTPDGFVLQENSDLSVSNWMDSTNEVTILSTQNQTVIPLPEGSRFFRLFRP